MYVESAANYDMNRYAKGFHDLPPNVNDPMTVITFMSLVSRLSSLLLYTLFFALLYFLCF